MPGYALSGAAARDLAAIAQYTVEAHGVEQAIIYRDHLIRAFEFLAQYPRAARERSELRQRSRVYPCQSHLIVYRIVSEGIVIQRVRHCREDWANDR